MGKKRKCKKMIAGMMAAVVILVGVNLPENVFGAEAEIGDLGEESIEIEEVVCKEAEERLALMSSEDDIASGVDGDIAWVINANGKLTVEGTGDFSEGTGESRIPWYSNLKSVISAEVNVTGMTDASYLFEGCRNLTDVDMSGFDTSQVTDMDGMFCYCSGLSELNLSSFDTSQVTDMWGMFSGCSGLSE